MLFIILIVVLSSLTACTTRRPTICVTNYPVQYLVQRIGGDRADLCMLTNGDIIQQASVVQDYSELIDDAQLIITMGQLEPYWELIRSEARASSAQIIDLVTTSAVYEFKRFTQVSAGGSVVILESDYYDGIDFNMIDTYDMDPILWMDPIAMNSMARRIRDWFIDYYPEDQRFFNENFLQLENDLVRLDSEFQILKNRGERIAFVSLTPGFGNWQKAYNVQVYPIMLSRYGALPNARQLELIKERIMSDGVEYIAFEPNLTPQLRELYTTLKEELNLTQVNLHNLMSLTPNEIEEGRDYLSIMYDNLSFLESMAEDSNIIIEEISDEE